MKFWIEGENRTELKKYALIMVFSAGMIVGTCFGFIGSIPLLIKCDTHICKIE